MAKVDYFEMGRIKANIIYFNQGKSLVWEENIVGAATIVADSRV